ncbi:MAG: hypothetical protein AB7T03_00890 [Bacilli bacterium]
MKIRDYFSNDFETGEEHYLPTLKTHYYRSRMEDVKNAILRFVEEEKGVVKAIIDEHHEIFFVTPTYSSTIIFVNTRIGETAIDIKITTYKLIPWLAGKKIIEKMYKYFDSHLPFKGISLYRGS